jgi:hypothetical protein
MGIGPIAGGMCPLRFTTAAEQMHAADAKLTCCCKNLLQQGTSSVWVVLRGRPPDGCYKA